MDLTTLPAFVINMAIDQERWKKFEHSWQNSRLKIERVEAIVGNDIRSTPLVHMMCKEFCTSGQIGCWASHLKIWQTIRTQHYPVSLILEDDAQPIEQFDDMLSTIVQSYLPHDFDICFLGAATGETNQFVNEFFADLSGITTRKPQIINRYVSIPENINGTCGYLLSEKGAAILIDRMSVITYHVDLVMVAQDIELYRTVPFLVTHSIGSTSLGESYDIQISDHLSTWQLNAPLGAIHSLNVTIKTYYLLPIGLFILWAILSGHWHFLICVPFFVFVFITYTRFCFGAFNPVLKQ